MTEPSIIQGGMGVAVSSWRLASTVSRLGQLGVVSGTALDVVLARRLQLGDPKGELRRALGSFPDPAVADRVLGAYFVRGGKPRDAPFLSVPMWTAAPTLRGLELAVVAGFGEVFLATEGHRGVVGINFLEKGRRVHRPARLADRVPLQGRTTRGDVVRAWRLCLTRTALRPGLPEEDLPPTRWNAGLSLPRGTGGRLPAQGRQVRGHPWRKCICNGLVATVGLGQGRASGPEPPIVTAGDDLLDLARLLKNGSQYSAADVVSHVLGRPVG